MVPRELIGKEVDSSNGSKRAHTEQWGDGRPEQKHTRNRREQHADTNGDSFQYIVSVLDDSRYEKTPASEE
jgi:hypothetical protein